MQLNLSKVAVRQHVRSKNATRWYRYSPQLKPIAEIDISFCQSIEDLEAVWKEEIGRDGKFTLVARRKHKFGFFGSIGRVAVKDGKITIEDNRCTLAALLRMNQRKFSEEKEEDFEMIGQ